MSMAILRNWFTHPLSFALLALLPALGMVALFALYHRRRALVRFGSTAMIQLLTRRRSKLHVLRFALCGLGLVLLIVAVAGPQWGRDGEQLAAPGRDVVLVLDLSRSMLAQDVLPNRAERAKRALEDLSHVVQQRGGHRLALVAFAARARVFCPLTHDYDHFREALAELEAANLPPELRAADGAARSGTRMGAGLRVAVEEHDPRFSGYQDILLLSDGDDPARDGEWRQGLEAARRCHIAVHTVGIGDSTVGSPIPFKNNEPLRHKGQVVTTRLEEEPLAEIARLTGGTYTPARTNTLQLGDLFHERIASQAAQERNDDALPLYRQHYPWFFGAAFVLLGLEMVVGRGKWKATPP